MPVSINHNHATEHRVFWSKFQTRSSIMVAVLVIFVFYLRNLFYVNKASLLSSPLPRLKRNRTDDNNDDDPSPILVLHVGPHKTATTTIQCDLTHYRKELYKKASVAYLGRAYGDCKRKKEEKNLFDTRQLIDECFGLLSPSPLLCKKSKIWKHLVRLLEDLSNRKKSVVISDEAFSRLVLHVDGRDNLRMLYKVFNTYFPGRVHVVVVYRRYFEWLLSAFNARNKPHTNDNDHKYKKDYEMWPSDGGKTCTSFKDFIDTGSFADDSYKGISQRKNLHPAEYVQWLWSNHSSKAMILNMHEMQNYEKEGITIRFVREILPPLVGDTLAKAASEESKFAGRQNPSMNVDFDRLAVAAHQRGLLVAIKSTTRGKVAEMAAEHLLKKLNTSTIDHLPRVCPNEIQLHNILGMSIEYEHRIYPNLSEESTKQHSSAFYKAAEGKYCNLDTDKLIENNAVQEFFTKDILPLLEKGRKVIQN